MQDLTVSEPKLSKICFSVVWQTQLAFPILGLTYGQLLGRTHDKEDQIISLRKQNENNERENHNKNVDEFENNVDISGILHDQLAVVTTKSFHLFSLSYSEEKTADKVDEIDRLVEELSSMIK